MLKRLDKEIAAWEVLENLESEVLDTGTVVLTHNSQLLSGLSQLQLLKERIEDTDNIADESYDTPDRNSSYIYLPPWTDTPEGAFAIRAIESGEINLGLRVLAGTICKRFSRNDQVLKNIDSRAVSLVGEITATANMARLFDSLTIKDSVSRKVTALCQDAANEVEAAGNAIEQADNELNAMKVRIADLETQLKKRASIKTKLFSRLVQRGVAEGQELHDRFLVQMRYKAPVKLWADRQELHEKNAKQALEQFYAGLIVFVLFLLFAVFAGGDYIANAFQPIGCDPAKPETCGGFSIRGTFTLAATTLLTSMGLWYLRFKMKVHLSERHLSLDAQERKAFAETFLALKEDKLVGEVQEAIVLESLFRPTQDGIIKDDMATDATPSGVISKLLSQSSTR